MRPTLSKLFPFVAVLLVIAALPAAADNKLEWQAALSSSTWHRPIHNRLGIATGAPTRYFVQPIYVTQSSVYEVDVDQPDTEDTFDGMVFLYAGPFDPKQPLLNLVAGSEVSPTRIADLLTAGAVYNAVVTSDNPQADRFRIELFGREPGEIHESNCAAHGAVAASDASSLGMVGGRFCVSVTWKDAAGASHVANPVAFRTDNSAAFWFFSPDTWELQVKVIDACAINKRFWVMSSGTTHMDYQINVEDITSQSSVQRRSYHNKLGDTRSTLDTQAFDGCPAGTAARR